MTAADDDNDDDQSMELMTMMPTRRTISTASAATTSTATEEEEEEEVLFEDGYEAEEEEYQDAEEEEDDGSNHNDMFLVLQNEDDYFVRSVGVNGFNFMGDDDDDDDDENDDSLAQEYFAALSSTANHNNNSSSNRKTIRFADNVRFVDEEYHDEDDNDDISLDIGASMKDSLNLFGTSSRSNRLTEAGVVGGTASTAAAAAMMTSKDGNSTDSESDMSEEEDEDNEVVDTEKEQEKQIVKTLLYAGFGFGLMTLAGMGAKKIMSAFSKSSDSNTPSPTDAVDAAQQAAMNGQMTPGLDPGMNDLALQGVQQLTTDTAANASMTASQGNMSSMAGGFYAPPPGMQGAQYVETARIGRMDVCVCAPVPWISLFVVTETLSSNFSRLFYSIDRLQVLQNMAVNAASNAAGAVASGSSAMAGMTAAGSAAAAAGGFAGLAAAIAAATIATKIAIAVALASVVGLSVGVGVGLAGNSEESALLNSGLNPSLSPTMTMSPTFVRCNVNESPERQAHAMIFPNIPSEVMVDLVPLDELFVTAYNTVSKECLERFQRYIPLEGVTFRGSPVWNEATESIEAEFTVRIVCNPSCPTPDRLFGDTLGSKNNVRRLQSADEAGEVVSEAEFNFLYNNLVQIWLRNGFTAPPTTNPSTLTGSSVEPTGPGLTVSPSTGGPAFSSSLAPSVTGASSSPSTGGIPTGTPTMTIASGSPTLGGIPTVPPSTTGPTFAPSIPPSIVTTLPLTSAPT
jgi:hypothetical protein